MRDFADEIPGYMNNTRIASELDALPIKSGREHLGENLRLCYDRLVQTGLIDAKEMPLVDAWLEGIGR